MNKLNLFILFIIFLISTNSYANEKPTLVVYDLIVKSKKITHEQAEILSNRMRSTIAKNGKYLLVSQDELQEHIYDYLKQRNFSEKSMCDEDSCMVEVAGALGANKIVTGKIAKIQNVYTIDLLMKDLLTKRISYSSTRDCSNCQIKDLLLTIEQAALEICGTDSINNNLKPKTYNPQTNKINIDKSLLNKKFEVKKSWYSKDSNLIILIVSIVTIAASLAVYAIASMSSSDSKHSTDDNLKVMVNIPPPTE